jgi:hypothetical protein
MIATLMGSSGSAERLYFLAGTLIALLPLAVFGTIGFLVVRAYLRDRARHPDPTGAARG